MRAIALWIKLLWLTGANLVAQESFVEEKGVPKIHNVMPGQYYNQGKIWEISDSPQGILYMAADGGLLEYDGHRWIYYAGSQGYTRSVLAQNDSLLFTGSDLDFGVWKRNDTRAFEYTSLYTFRDEASKLNEEFWDVFNIKNKVCFVSPLNIYTYQNELLTRIAAPNRFVGQAKLGDTLYLSDEKEGLFSFDGWNLKKVVNFPSGNAFDIVGSYELGKEIVFVTRNQGSWVLTAGQWNKVNNALTSRLEKAGVFCFKEITEDKLAFGTVLQGLIIADKRGRIIHQIDKQKGLLNNTVLSLHRPNRGVLWMGMDYGVASLDLESCVTYVDDIKGEFGTAQTGLLFNKRLYLGTNQGLYSIDWDALSNNLSMPTPKSEPGTAGQVWSLARIGGESFMGHDKGLFMLVGNNWQQVSADPGVWTIVPFRDGLLTGTYRGVSYYDKEGGKWRLIKKIDDIFGSCNQILVESDTILWVSIPNYGIVRASITPSLKIDHKSIFQTSEIGSKDWQLVEEENEVKIRTPTTVYVYDTTSDSLLPAAISASYSREDQQPMPEFSSKVILNDNFEFLPRYNGFALRKKNCQRVLANQNPPKLQWRRAWSFNNESEHPVADGAIIPFESNNIRIFLAAPDATNPAFEWRFHDTDTWTSLGTDPVLTVLDIPVGKNTIFIRALADGSYTLPIAFKVAVSRPWFLSWQAILFWIFILAAGMFFGITRYKRALRKQQLLLLSRKQKALEEQHQVHQRQLAAFERDTVQKENDWLKTQLKNKTVELATKAKENDDKNRLLVNIKAKLEELAASPQQEKARLIEIKRLLDRMILVEDKTFEIQMDDLHQEFFKKLRLRFPMLTPNDLRLCAYLKIGLSSKETADLLNVQPSSLYISRSRLRQKLELSPKDDLSAFLNSL